MNWHAYVRADVFRTDYSIHIVHTVNDVDFVLLNGGQDLTEHPRGADAEPVLTLCEEALDALRDALNEHRPPADDADLREALAVERRRVDYALGIYECNPEEDGV